MLDLMVDLMKSTWTLGNPSSGIGPFFAPSVTHLFIKTFSPATLLLTQMNQQLFDDLRDLQRRPKQLSGATYSQGGDVRMKTSQAYFTSSVFNLHEGIFSMSLYHYWHFITCYPPTTHIMSLCYILSQYVVSGHHTRIFGAFCPNWFLYIMS